jgi:hypothetical protein
MATCHHTTAVPIEMATSSPQYHSPCGFARAELMNAVTTHSSDSLVYKVYFRPTADGNIVCASCGLGVGYHHDAPTAPALAPVAVYPATEVVMHDADAVEGVVEDAADPAVDGYRGMVCAGAGLALICAFFIDYNRTSYAKFSFYILATTMTIIDIAVGFLSHFAPNAFARKIPYKFGVAWIQIYVRHKSQFVFAWILAIVMVTATFCGYSPLLHYYILGASPILMTVVFLCSIGVGVVDVVMAPRNRNEARPAP